MLGFSVFPFGSGKSPNARPAPKPKSIANTAIARRVFMCKPPPASIRAAYYPAPRATRKSRPFVALKNSRLNRETNVTQGATFDATPFEPLAKATDRQGDPWALLQ